MSLTLNRETEKVLQGIRKNNFLVIGRAGMDLSPHPAGTKTEEASEFVSGLGGSAANIAVGICKFGGKSALVTNVSDDAVGRFCYNQLTHYGVDTRYVKPIGGEFRNSLAIYETRVEDHQSVIYRNGAADFQMSIEDVEAVDYSSFGAVITAGTVFASEPSRSATFRAFELAKQAGLPIIFDIDYRPYSWPSPKVAEEVLSKAGRMSDVIVGNDEEFGFMAGHVDRGLALAEELAGDSGGIVIYKMGEKGAVTFASETRFQSGIYPVEALKPTGAGDSFMAGLLSSLANNHDLQDAVLRGSACAAIVVAKPGCAPAMPNIQQLEEFIRTHPGPTIV